MERIAEAGRTPIAKRYGSGEKRDANIRLIGMYECGEMRKYEGREGIKKVEKSR